MLYAATCDLQKGLSVNHKEHRELLPLQSSAEPAQAQTEFHQWCAKYGLPPAVGAVLEKEFGSVADLLSTARNRHVDGNPCVQHIFPGFSFCIVYPRVLQAYK